MENVKDIKESKISCTHRLALTIINSYTILFPLYSQSFFSLLLQTLSCIEENTGIIFHLKGNF